MLLTIDKVNKTALSLSNYELITDEGIKQLDQDQADCTGAGQLSFPLLFV